jgi:DNA-binding GntR family transcriptional regulator
MGDAVLTKDQTYRYKVDVPTLSTQLASQIMDRVRRLKMPVGSHLPEQDLADFLRVSRTPVREALRFLQQMNVVERRPNRGFFVTKAAELLEFSPIYNGQDIEDSVYFQIAEDRLSGLLPARFTENELVRRYGVSRARLLRLLVRMTKEGWLERLPGHGWEFQQTLGSPRAYEQSYRFRMLIEPAALLEPGYKIDSDALASCRQQQQAMLDGGILRYSRIETFHIGASLHETLVAGSGNPFFVDALRRVNRMRRLIEYRITSNRTRLIQQCKEHLILLDLMEAGDREGAAAFLRNHLDNARTIKTGLAIDLKDGEGSDHLQTAVPDKSGAA